MERFVKWKYVKESDILKSELFYDVDMSLAHDTQRAFHTVEFGSITILDRETGFSDGCGGYFRDVETGYRDNDGKFWLASGDFDILKIAEGKTIGESIELIKKNANNCRGK